MKRLFLAIDPSEDVRTALAEFQKKPFEKLDRQGMRWMNARKYCVEVCFLGDMPIDSVSEVCSRIVSSYPTPKLSLGKMTGLPDTKRPGLIGLAVVDNSGALSRLQSELKTGLEVESDEYTPVLSLARMKPSSTKLGHKLRDYIHSGAHPDPLSWSPDSVSLYDAKPDGSFELLKSYSFK